MGSILFWVVAVALLIAVTGLILAALSQGDARDSAAADLQVYRDQLKEVDRDLERGVIADDEAARLKVEIGRRVLAADQALHRGETPGRSGPRRLLTGAVIALIMIVVTLGTYISRGQPGLGDLPMSERLAESEAMRAARPSQAEAEATQAARTDIARPAPEPQHAELVAQLREAVAARPGDLQGQRLLARNEASLGNFAAAARAQGAIVQILGNAATAEDLAVQAELMIMATGGTVTAESEAVLVAALELDPSNPTARYFSGMLFAQIARYDLAFRFWSTLWQASTSADPWVQPLREQLPDVAWLAGQHRYQMPPLREADAPDAAAIEAAREMSPEDRAAMVRGMVDRLMERLATEGGSADEWGRLIHALSVLGDTERAKSILAEAQERFAGRQADLDKVHAAAKAAGLTE